MAAKEMCIESTPPFSLTGSTCPLAIPEGRHRLGRHLAAYRGVGPSAVAVRLDELYRTPIRIAFPFNLPNARAAFEYYQTGTTKFTPQQPFSEMIFAQSPYIPNRANSFSRKFFSGSAACSSA